MATVTSNLVQSPAMPKSALESLPILEELLKRKTPAGEEYVFFHSGKNAEARLRDEFKRRLNIDSESRLPDDTMEMVRETVKLVILKLNEKMHADGYAVKSASFGKPFVQWEKDSAQPKADGLRNRMVSERDLRNDGERLVCYQEERRKLAKRLASMNEKPGEYTRDEIALIQARHDAAHAVCVKIAPIANS